MKPRLIKIHSGKFDEMRMRCIKNSISSLFNEYTANNDLSTILVVVQFKNGTQKQYWAMLPIKNPNNVAHIALYKVEQVIEFIN